MSVLFLVRFVSGPHVEKFLFFFFNKKNTLKRNSSISSSWTLVIYVGKYFISLIFRDFVTTYISPASFKASGALYNFYA